MDGMSYSCGMLVFAQCLGLTRQLAAGVSYELRNGAAQGPLLILVHGMPGRVGDFHPLVSTSPVSHSLRCLSLDLPGHGESPAFRDGRDPDDRNLAQSVWDVVDAASGASGEPVVLLGHSAGGHTVLAAAALRPKQTLGVALLSPCGVTPHLAVGNAWGYRTVVRPLAQLSQRPAWRALLGALLALALGASRLLGAPSAMTAEEILHTQRRSGLYDFEAAEANVLALEAPVFHAYARDDPLIQPERFEELEALLARSPRRAGPRLCWPEGGHYVQQTHAAELSEALNAWVQTEL